MYCVKHTIGDTLPRFIKMLNSLFRDLFILSIISSQQKPLEGNVTQVLVSSSKTTDINLGDAFKLEKEKRICNQKNSVQMADPTPIVHYVGPCESNSLHEGTIL